MDVAGIAQSSGGSTSPGGGSNVCARAACSVAGNTCASTALFDTPFSANDPSSSSVCVSSNDDVEPSREPEEVRRRFGVNVPCARGA